MQEQRNLLLAVALSIAIIFGYQFLIERPRHEAEQARLAEEQTATVTVEPEGAGVPSPTEGSAPLPADNAGPAASRVDVLEASPRIPIQTSRLRGSVSREGGRIDDLLLLDYREELAKDSPNITLLSPRGADKAYYAEFGWVPSAGSTAPVPNQKTLWDGGGSIVPGKPATLRWDNGQGVLFETVYTLDEDFMFTVTQRIVNRSDSAISLAPYALIARRGTPAITGFAILHEGPLGVFNGSLKEIDYEDLSDDGDVTAESTGGWLGMTGKYWLAALIPDQAAPYKARFTHRAVAGDDQYQVDYLRESQTVQPGGSLEVTNRFFAGAKEVATVDRYNDTLGITRFDLAIDWGYFRPMTRPLFFLLDFFYKYFGNFGVAILLLTVSVKAALFWFSNKSYEGMARMKELQPKIQQLRERYKDDRQRQQTEMINLYKTEKVNPMAGCWPMLIQIPVFFALYKVLFMTIEMRHAPFFGWIKDLSAPDPLTPVNLFGLIPWDPPQMIAIGIWPIVMGVSMYLQQKLNPQPADPVQAKVFMLMPILFTFMLGSFPAGLVIYWTWNNVLTIAQQWYIMQRATKKKAAV